MQSGSQELCTTGFDFFLGLGPRFLFGFEFWKAWLLEGIIAYVVERTHYL